MKRHTRASRILKAVNYNDESHVIDDSKDIHFVEDPYKNSDDDMSDPSYLPEKTNICLTRESSGSLQTCEYLSCTSEVFAACDKCSSFLCWDHFENAESSNYCEYHRTKNDFDTTLIGTSSNEKTLTEHDSEIFDDMNIIQVATISSQHHNNNNDSLTPTSTYQHCEFSACFEEVSSTCVRCQGFLCAGHFVKFMNDDDCSMHKSFSSESTNLSNPTKEKQSKKKTAKVNRNLGLQYTNSKNKIIKARSLKQPRCNMKSSCKFKCCDLIDEQIRKRIFDSYWSLGDINRQRDYIRKSTEEIKPKYRYPCENCNTEKKMRGFNYAFYFEVEQKKLRVCKEFFKSTLDINDRVIKTVRDKTNLDGFVADDRRGKHDHRSKKTQEAEIVRKFINAIPRVESHYLRAQTSREFIEGGKTLTELYNDYKKLCEDESKPCVSKTLFSKIFYTDFNISFFTPKKDRCEVCVSYENSSEVEKAEMQQTFDTHQREKELSRAEKKLDKDKVSPTYIVACYDLQAALTTPRGEVSVFYYISKLSTYNLSVSELVTGLTTCFVWHEGQGHRGVTEIGTCIFRFLKNKSLCVNSDNLDIVFYSDNCCGQQKNKFMTALYIYAVNKLKINSITHKFLIKGHTQNEGDAVHSTIEKNIKKSLKCGPIYCSQEYVTLIKTAKKNPPYYSVEQLSFDDFYDVKSLCDQMGNNYTKSTYNDVIKVNDIKIIRVLKEDPLAFYVKTSYADDFFKRIEIRKKLNTRNMINFILPDALNKAYTEKIKISEKKKQDILKLIEKRHIPQIYFDFYNSL